MSGILNPEAGMGFPTYKEVFDINISVLPMFVRGFHSGDPERPETFDSAYSACGALYEDVYKLKYTTDENIPNDIKNKYKEWLDLYFKMRLDSGLKVTYEFHHEIKQDSHIISIKSKDYGMAAINIVLKYKQPSNFLNKFIKFFK